MGSRRGWKPSRNEDFQESDVWDIMTKAEAISTDCEQPYEGLLSRRLQSAARLIPKARNLTPEHGMVQHSAPVDIPDWSKVYGNTPKESLFTDQHWCDDGDFTRKRFTGHARNDDDCCEYEDSNDDQMRRIPPHLWVARRHSRSSFSVCEGAGRTLKGRDLTRVRDAVLTQTGFIG